MAIGEAHADSAGTELLVEAHLVGRHVRVQQDLALWRQAVLHICLDAPQHEGPQDAVQLARLYQKHGHIMHNLNRQACK